MPKQYKIRFMDSNGKTQEQTMNNREVIEFYQNKQYMHIINIKRI
jgi:hypothetical protein